MPLADTDFRPTALRRRAGHRQLKRNPLGGGGESFNMKTILVILLLGCLPPSWLFAQKDTLSVHRTGLTFMPTIGAANGAGNDFLDVALAASVYVDRLELRIHVGALGFSGACALLPSKCGAGDGEYYGGSVGFRFPDQTRPAGAWIVSVGPGGADGRNVTTLGVTVGRDQPIGGRWLLRFELFGRHLFDDVYRDTWGSSHRQFGVRLGLGGWTSLY